MRHITAEQFCREMEVFCPDYFVEADFKFAKKSGLNTKNSEDMRVLVEAWSRGFYDEDPYLLCDEVLRAVNRKNDPNYGK